MSTKVWKVGVTAAGALGGFIVGTVVGGIGFSLIPWVEGCGPLGLVCGGFYFGIPGLGIGGMLAYAFGTRSA